MNKNGKTPRKLTREELLAGKVAPDDTPHRGSSDPRVKSPDELLMALLSQKKNADSSPNLKLDKEEIKSRNDAAFQSASPSQIPMGPLTNTKSKGVKPAPIINSDNPDQSAINPNTHQILKLDEKPAEKRDELKALRERYETEIARWQEYDQKVNHWKERVMEIVQSLKSDVKNMDALRRENQELKKRLATTSNELAELKFKSKKTA